MIHDIALDEGFYFGFIFPRLFSVSVFKCFVLNVSAVTIFCLNQSEKFQNLFDLLRHKLINQPNIYHYSRYYLFSKFTRYGDSFFDKFVNPLAKHFLFISTEIL